MIENLLLSYAQDLDDAYPKYEFSIWGRSQLLKYFNEALCLIAAHRPDMFTELKVIKVDPCSNYLDTCECVKVLDILGQSDKHGNNLRPIPKRSNTNAVWTGTKKRKGLTTQLTGYEILGGSSFIRVLPENLDPNKDIYVVVRCSVEPKHYSLTDEAPDERCAFLAAARHWVLYNAKMIDGEFSQTMQAQAREHREMFISILGIVKQADDEFDKEVQDKKELQQQRR